MMAEALWLCWKKFRIGEIVRLCLRWDGHPGMCDGPVIYHEKKWRA